MDRITAYRVDLGPSRYFRQHHPNAGIFLRAPNLSGPTFPHLIFDYACSSITYDQTTSNTADPNLTPVVLGLAAICRYLGRLPSCSAIHKLRRGRLVLRWVTTWEYRLLYVFDLSLGAHEMSSRLLLIFSGKKSGGEGGVKLVPKIRGTRRLYDAFEEIGRRKGK